MVLVDQLLSVRLLLLLASEMCFYTDSIWLGLLAVTYVAVGVAVPQFVSLFSDFCLSQIFGEGM